MNNPIAMMILHRNTKVTVHSPSNDTVFFNIAVGCPRSVMVKVMDFGIVVIEFALQSRYYVHFRANTIGKG